MQMELFCLLYFNIFKGAVVFISEMTTIILGVKGLTTKQNILLSSLIRICCCCGGSQPLSYQD